MNTINEALDGRKTYAAAGVLIVYLIVTAINQQEPDESVVSGLLAAIGVFLRAGVAKGG